MMALVQQYCAENGCVIMPKSKKEKSKVRKRARSSGEENFYNVNRCGRFNRSSLRIEPELSQESSSEVTIYRNAVKRASGRSSCGDDFVNNKRNSSSSEGVINTSDEIDDNQDLTRQFVAGCQVASRWRMDDEDDDHYANRPSTSRGF